MTLDEAHAMIVGWKKGTGEWTMHDGHRVWSLTISSVGKAEEGGLDETELLRNFEYEEHGLWLWCAWFIGGILMLISMRYTKKYYTFVHYFHAVLGYFILIVTVTFVFKLTGGTHWHLFGSTHTTFGNLCLIVTLIGAISGSLTAGMMRFKNDKPWTAEEKATKVARIHRWFGYFMILLGNFSAASGIGHYYGDVM